MAPAEYFVQKGMGMLAHPGFEACVGKGGALFGKGPQGRSVRRGSSPRPQFLKRENQAAKTVNAPLLGIKVEARPDFFKGFPHGRKIPNLKGGGEKRLQVLDVH